MCCFLFQLVFTLPYLYCWFENPGETAVLWLKKCRLLKLSISTLLILGLFRNQKRCLKSKTNENFCIRVEPKSETVFVAIILSSCTKTSSETTYEEFAERIIRSTPLVSLICILKIPFSTINRKECGADQSP